MFIQTARKKPEEVSPRAKLGPNTGQGAAVASMIFALCTNPEQKLNKKNQQNRANYPDFRQKTGYLTC